MTRIKWQNVYDLSFSFNLILKLLHYLAPRAQPANYYFLRARIVHALSINCCSLQSKTCIPHTRTHTHTIKNTVKEGISAPLLVGSARHAWCSVHGIRSVSCRSWKPCLRRPPHEQARLVRALARLVRTLVVENQVPMFKDGVVVRCMPVWRPRCMRSSVPSINKRLARFVGCLLERTQRDTIGTFFLCLGCEILKCGKAAS